MEAVYIQLSDFSDKSACKCVKCMQMQDKINKRQK